MTEHMKFMEQARIACNKMYEHNKRLQKFILGYPGVVGLTVVHDELMIQTKGEFDHDKFAEELKKVWDE